jgi:hypothetical protein
MDILENGMAIKNNDRTDVNGKRKIKDFRRAAESVNWQKRFLIVYRPKEKV